jgi:hypothetical protein
LTRNIRKHAEWNVETHMRCASVPDEGDDASTHLVGRLVGERDRHDLPGTGVARGEDVRDAPS